MRGEYDSYGRVDVAVVADPQCEEESGLGEYDCRGKLVHETSLQQVDRIQVGVDDFDRNQVEAKAVYCFGECGVEFGALPTEQQKEIKRFLAQQEAQNKEQEASGGGKAADEEEKDETFPSVITLANLEDTPLDGTRFCVPEGISVLGSLSQSTAKMILEAEQAKDGGEEGAGSAENAESGNRKRTGGSSSSSSKDGGNKRLKAVEDAKRVTVTTISGDSVDLEVAGQTVRALKASVERARGIPASLQEIYVQDRAEPLANGEELHTLPIDSNTGRIMLTLLKLDVPPPITARMPPKPHESGGAGCTIC